MGAVEAFGDGSWSGDEAAIVAVCALIENPHPEIRRAAVQALSKLAERGDGLAADEITGRIGHWLPTVRQTALECLGRFVTEGDEQARTCAHAWRMTILTSGG